MKKIAGAFTSFSLLCLLSASALADHKDLKEKVTISSKVWVNGAEVKPGNYLVRYNADTSEMTLERNGKVVARSKATVVINGEKFDRDILLTRGSDEASQLIGVRLGGQREEIQLVDVTAETPQEQDDEIFLMDIF